MNQNINFIVYLFTFHVKNVNHYIFEAYDNKTYVFPYNRDLGRVGLLNKIKKSDNTVHSKP